jgi:hypothetical protein
MIHGVRPRGVNDSNFGIVGKVYLDLNHADPSQKTLRS